MIDQKLDNTLQAISEFFNRYKVGYEGNKGYRKTTDLFKLHRAVEDLERLGLINKEQTVFWDLGCGDGRVNLFMSYLVKFSIGTEIEPTIFEECEIRKTEIEDALKKKHLLLPPPNMFLYLGDSLSKATQDAVFRHTGYLFNEIDIFYTYITLHDLFAEQIINNAKSGALYLVYGFSKILPSYDGMELVNPDVGKQNIMTLYRKL